MISSAMLSMRLADPVFVKDEEHRFVLVNDAEVALLGYPREELIGKNDKDFFPEEEVKIFWEGDQQVLASGIENVNEEAITDMRSGETRVIVTRKTRYVDSRGRRFIVGISTDITDRKRSEDAVKRAYDFVENIINAIADPVFVKDEEHRFVLVNDAALALWGYRREELIGKTDTNFFAEDEVKVFWERDHQVLVTGEENINEEYITGMRKDETRALITRKTRYVDSAGKRYIVGISSDITERKRAEEALRISEERFRIAAATVSDFIYERDMTTGEAEFFGDMEGCLGYAPGTFPRSLNGWLECIHPDDFAQVLQNLQQAPEHGGKYTLGYRIRRGNGTYANWEETGIILQDSNGTPTKCVGSANDVTARKQAEADREKMEEQLRQAQKMEAVGLLAGGVAHEFNNLLQVILGLVEMVQMDVGVDSSNGRLLEDVNRAGKRAAELTQELLAFSRRQTLMPVNVDLNALVDAEINMLRPLIGANIEVHFIPGAAVNTIRADKRQIEVVLMNLCINARDAMPHGGMLTIETDCAELDAVFCSKHEGVVTGTYARLTVTDTGHGMDETKRAQIFDPFYTTKKVGEGSGLGLATVYGIVTQHKGAIDVASEVGKGTTFSVYLPIAEGAVEEERPRVRRLGPGGTETILVAEDDEMLLSLLEKILTKSGYTVLLARNGEEAVGLFEEHADKIDMALLDVIMPILGGQHVMEKIQAVAPDMKFLFSSGYSENAIQTDFIIKDGLRLIKKPYKSSELLQAVRDTLDMSA
jgi:two-component system, cell cycle sensor histidine kinase and response regulator CckA